jgi:hypothetical protein
MTRQLQLGVGKSTSPDRKPGSWATIKGDYRYTLGRKWGEGPRVLWVMLNPSTADHRKDDPTLTRCLGFSRGWDFASLEVVNLFAYRSKDPADLTRVFDPLGPENDRWINDAAARATEVIVAWGAKIPRGWKGRPDRVLHMLRRHQAPVRCLGTTKDGHPRHPLYLSSETGRRAFQ